MNLLSLMFSDISVNRKSGLLTWIFFVNYRLSRYLYVQRSKNKFLSVFLFAPYVFFSLSNKFIFSVTGSSIPASCFLGERLFFIHGIHGVYISGLAKISDDITIFHNVTIGSNFGSEKNFGAPSIGDGVLIGAGAILIGNIKIGAGAKIGAGSVIARSVPMHATCYASSFVMREQ